MPSIKFLLRTCLVMISIFIRYLSEIRATWYRRSIHAVIYFKCHQVNHYPAHAVESEIANFSFDNRKFCFRWRENSAFSFEAEKIYIFFIHPPIWFPLLPPLLYFSADPFMLNRISPFLLTSPQILQKKRRKENREITALWRGKAVQSSIILLLSDRTLPRFSSMCVHKLSSTRWWLGMRIV